MLYIFIAFGVVCSEYRAGMQLLPFGQQPADPFTQFFGIEFLDEQILHDEIPPV